MELLSGIGVALRRILGKRRHIQTANERASKQESTKRDATPQRGSATTSISAGSPRLTNAIARLSAGVPWLEHD
jgi:hypothetical protein